MTLCSCVLGSRKIANKKKNVYIYIDVNRERGVFEMRKRKGKMEE